MCLEKKHGLAVNGERERHLYMTIYPSDLRLNSLELTDSGRDLNH